MDNILNVYQVIWTTLDGEREYTSHTTLYACKNIAQAKLMAWQETRAMFEDGRQDDAGWWDASGETCTTYRVQPMPTQYAQGYDGYMYRLNIPTLTLTQMEV